MAARRRKPKKTFKFLFRMKKKLLILFILIIGCLIFMIGRLVFFEVTGGDRYEKKVLSNQVNDSSVIPFRRGDIVDRKGTVLATSTDVYNVILDCSVITDKDEYLEPTMEALKSCFDESELYRGRTYSEIEAFITNNPDNKYYQIAEKLPYEEIEKFKELQSEGKYIKGIWFEKEYVREYPYGSLASALIGYTAAGNEGIGGLEGYYDSTLDGTDGREYGYLNADSNYEVNIKEPINGETIVSTIDANMQTIVERKMKEFYDRLTNNTTQGGGAEHIAVLIMNPNNGEVLTMADYPNYDYTMSSDDNLKLFYTEEEIKDMDEKQMTKALEGLKQNFAITYTYEPGSTAKPFTVACGLDTGTLTEDMTFVCDGVEKIADYDIHCVNRNGHGVETLSGSLEDSCNDALMQMSYKIGAKNFAQYQQLFNFGLKTNIDLPGESRTNTLIYPESQLNTINLATNSFGQNFNVTMIQIASAYSSLVNGGSYYLPHMALKTTDEDGNTVEDLKPILLKRTVSEETAATVRGYLQAVVDQGTGKTAKVDGYSMTGKTGTAQKYVLDEDGNATSVRAQGRYLVSFIGAVPAENPQLVIYCIVDEPNTDDQAHSTYAQNIVREVLKEVLPYMNIYPDQELDGRNKYLNIIGEEDYSQPDDDESEEEE